VFIHIGHRDSGARIQVGVWLPFDPRTSTIAEIHRDIALKVHDVLRVAAAGVSPQSLRARLDAWMETDLDLHDD
jgi:hypothetical protein